MTNSRSKTEVTGMRGVGAARGAGTAGTGSGNEAPAMTVVRHGERGLVVSAKAVHRALGVRRIFSSWFNGRIRRYGFELGVDFWPLVDATSELTPERVQNTSAHEYSTELGESSGGFTPKRAKNTQGVGRGRGRPELDYWLSLDMAKELAMLERSDAGRAARKYFLDCERKLKEVLTHGQPRLEPEMRLTQEEADVFNRFRGWLREGEAGNYTAMQINDELGYVVLPEILKQVLHEGGLNDAAIAKIDLRGYASILCTAIISARCDVNPDDVAIRMRTKKMSPRIVEMVRRNTQAFLLDRPNLRARKRWKNQVYLSLPLAYARCHSASPTDGIRAQVILSLHPINPSTGQDHLGFCAVSSTS